MPEISRTAQFSPSDPLPHILEDLACPACGHQQPGARYRSVVDKKMRIFCDRCGAFITISLSDEQARVLRELGSDPVDSRKPTSHSPARAPLL